MLTVSDRLIGPMAVKSPGQPRAQSHLCEELTQTPGARTVAQPDDGTCHFRSDLQ